MVLSIPLGYAYHVLCLTVSQNVSTNMMLVPEPNLLLPPEKSNLHNFPVTPISQYMLSPKCCFFILALLLLG